MQTSDIATGSSAAGPAAQRVTRVRTMLSGPLLDVLTTAAILVTCGTLLWANWSRRPPAPRIPRDPLDVAGAPSKGAAGAPVVLIEWSDFECPYCGKVVRDTLPGIDTHFIQSGKVRIVFKYHPLEEIHSHALIAAQAAVCADRQHRFWAMHDSLFADQRHLDERSIMQRAETLGLDLTAFRSCLGSNSDAAPRADGVEAEHLGLDSTPVFLVGHPTQDGRVKIESIINGAQPEAVFAAALAADGSPNRWRWIAAVLLVIPTAVTATGLLRRRMRISR